jgi:hypothetical protein
MMSPNTPEDSLPWYRQFWPWLLIFFPAATVVAGMATLWIATREPVALVKDDYYKEGLAINQDIAKDELATKMQLRTELHFDLDSKNTRAIVTGPFTGATLKLAFIHPVKITLDDWILLQRQADGSYTGPLPVRTDRWYLELEDPAPAEPWRLKGEVDLRKGRTVLLEPNQG